MNAPKAKTIMKDLDLTAIKRRMAVKYPYFGSVIAGVNYIADESVETIAGDGEAVYYNPVYFSTLMCEEQLFFFIHEICHVAFDHVYRSDGRDPELWSTATDAVINAFLALDGVKPYPGSVIRPEAAGYDAESYYEFLLSQSSGKEPDERGTSGENAEDIDRFRYDESQTGSRSESGERARASSQEKAKDSPTSDGSGSAGERDTEEVAEGGKTGHSRPSGVRNHGMWPEAVERKRRQIKEAPAEDAGDGETQTEPLPEENRECAPKKRPPISEKDAFARNRQKRRRQLEELKKALARSSAGAGSEAGNRERETWELGREKPLVDWRYVLRDTLNFDLDWSFQHAEIEDGVVKAYLEEQPKLETEIVIDTSGSINEPLLRSFLHECKNVLQHSRIKVGCFDTVFYGFHEISSEEDLDSLVLQGGGGTDFNAAVSAFTKPVDNRVVFTDGDAPPPRSAIDAVWLVYGDIPFSPPGGRVIRIDRDLLRRRTGGAEGVPAQAES